MVRALRGALLLSMTLVLGGGLARGDEIVFSGGSTPDGPIGLTSFTVGDRFTIEDGYVDNVSANGQSWGVVDGFYNLTSPLNTSASLLSGAGCVNDFFPQCTGTWKYGFGAGGSFALYGYVPALGVSGPCDSITGSCESVLLFSGTFLSAVAELWIREGDGYNGGTFRGVFDPASIYVNPQLLLALGLPNQFEAGQDFQYVLGFMLPDDLGSEDPTSGGFMWWDAAVIDTEVSATPVPEPASLVLMGSGFLALGIFAGHRKQRQQHVS